MGRLNDPEVIRAKVRDYLRKGWCPISVGSGKEGKAPRLDTWTEYQKRLPTEEEIASWDGSGGVGIVLGEVSHLVVLDIDYRAGGKKSVQGRPSS